LLSRPRSSLAQPISSAGGVTRAVNSSPNWSNRRGSATASDHPRLLFLGAGWATITLCQASIGWPFKGNSSSRRQLIGSLNYLHRRRQSPPLGVFALGILPFINRFDHPAAAHSGHSQLEDLQTERRGGPDGARFASHRPMWPLGWGVLQSTVLPDPAAVRPAGCNPEPCLRDSDRPGLSHRFEVVMWISEVITERGIGQGASW